MSDTDIQRDFEKCKVCGQPLGSNKDCDECLNYLIEKGAKEVDEPMAERAELDARKWMETRGKKAPSTLFNLVKLFSEMISDYFKGKYKQVPWRTIATAAFAVLYAINIFDLVPDIIPVLGWLDDVAVGGLAIFSIKKDLKEYCIFKGYNPEDYGLKIKSSSHI